MRFPFEVEVCAQAQSGGCLHGKGSAAALHSGFGGNGANAQGIGKQRCARLRVVQRLKVAVAEGERVAIVLFGAAVVAS